VFASLEGCLAEEMELLFVTPYFYFSYRLLLFLKVLHYIQQGCPTGSLWPAGLFCAAPRYYSSILQNNSKCLPPL
jgi:hypothetical protein